MTRLNCPTVKFIFTSTNKVYGDTANYLPLVPNSWTKRKYGESKLKIKEMGSRYFFILVYCFVEKKF